MPVTLSVPRPLRIGEILDRAITLSARHAWGLASISAVPEASAAALTYVQAPSQEGRGIVSLVVQPTAGASRAPSVETRGFSAATADLVNVAVYVGLAMACSVALVDIVQGRRVAVRETYVATMRCWRAILVALAAGGGVAAFELVLWFIAMWLVTQVQMLCGTTASAGGKLLYNVIALSLVSLFVVVAVFAVKFIFASIALGGCLSMPVTRSKPPVPPKTSLLCGHNATALLSWVYRAKPRAPIIAPRFDETFGSDRSTCILRQPPSRCRVCAEGSSSCATTSSFSVR